LDRLQKECTKDIKKAPPEVKEQRYATCKSCPFYVEKTDSCGKLFRGGTVEVDGEFLELCGCILNDKTGYADDACPIGKWTQHN
jgi:hypothetical protein